MVNVWVGKITLNIFGEMTQSANIKEEVVCHTAIF